MIQTGFESKVKVQQIINNQLPSFLLDENPKSVDFLKQYYISQEYQGGPVDIAENLDEYLKLDNLTPEVVVDILHQEYLLLILPFLLIVLKDFHRNMVYLRLIMKLLHILD